MKQKKLIYASGFVVLIAVLLVIAPLLGRFDISFAERVHFYDMSDKSGTPHEIDARRVSELVEIIGDKKLWSDDQTIKGDYKLVFSGGSRETSLVFSITSAAIATEDGRIMHLTFEECDAIVALLEESTQISGGQ